MASDFSIRLAARIVKNGGVIAYPTDTIYGLGCNPLDHVAVARINQIKNRPTGKSCILLASNIEQLSPYISLNDKGSHTLLSQTVPTSWIVNAAPHCPTWLVGENNTVAIRLTNNHNVKRLCEAVHGAVISTSANPSGLIPAATGARLHQYFHHLVDMILLADAPSGNKASKLIRLCDNHVIRE